METEIQTKSYLEWLRRERYKKVTIAFSVLFLVFLVYELVSFYQKKLFLRDRLDESSYSVKDRDAVLESYLGDNPKFIQDSFLADITNGVNDKFTKTDAYFIAHRYFDNGGNVYEIYDYVNSHKNLAFLKEADQIYPGIFERIKTKSLEPTYSAESMYAVLAYMEVLDRYGYADMATLSTAANQYAKMAYFTKKKSERTSNVDGSPIVKSSFNKAFFFAIKARDNIVKISDETGIDFNDMEKFSASPSSFQSVVLKDITGRSLLVGLNQYAATLRYLEVAGGDISSLDKPLKARDIFALTRVMSKEFYVSLEFFTALLDASTLSLVSPESTDAIRTALQPIIDFDSTKIVPKGIILKIFDAKNDKSMGLDVYGKINIVTLGNIVPEFKEWLIFNGWEETDFR